MRSNSIGQPAGPRPAATRPLTRAVGFWGGVAIMLGIIIGSGIFRTPPWIAQQVSSYEIVLGLWALGGVIACLGALTYSELATMHPESGGVYVFLREGYGRAVAFVFGWTYMLITKPAAAGGIAIVCAEHLNTLLPFHVDPRVATTVILVVLTGVNLIGVRAGARVAMVLTALKFGVLVAIVVLALARWMLVDEALVSGPVTGVGMGLSASTLVGVMSAIMWTYDGWSDVGAIAGEVKNPQRMLPRIYLAGTAAAMGIYLAVNAAYFSVVGMGEMSGLDTVAPVVAERLLGSLGVAGAGVAAVVVVLSTLGSTHGSIITGARVTFAQARDGLMFSMLGRVNARFATPDASLLTQLLLSCAAVWYSGGFQNLANTFTFTMWIFYGLAGSAIFVLRVRRPKAERPYRCWGYPVVPAVFVACAAGMTALSIVTDIIQSYGRNTLPWLGVLLIGFPVYWVWSWARAKRAPKEA